MMEFHILDYFQMFWISFSSLFIEYFFCKACLGRKNGKKGIFVLTGYWLFRFVFQQMFFTFYLGRMYSQEIWYGIAFSFLHMFAMLLYIFVFCYAFQGDVVKIAMAIFVIETFCSACIMACQWVTVGSVNTKFEGINLVEVGKVMAGVFLSVLISFTTYKLLYRFMIRFQNYTIKHVKFFGFLISVQYLTSFYINSDQNALSGRHFRSFTGKLGVCALGVLLLLACFSIGIFVQRKSKKRKLQSQLYHIKHNRQASLEQTELNRQQQEMRETFYSLSYLEDHEEQQLILQRYIEGLKENYQKIQAGIYCQNRRMDAFLVNLAKYCQKENVRLEIGFQEYQGTIMEQNAMENILWALFQVILQAEIQEIFLHASEMQKNTVIWLRILRKEWDKENQKSNKKKIYTEMKPYLRKYKGIMTVEREGDYFDIKMMFD